MILKYFGSELLHCCFCLWRTWSLAEAKNRSRRQGWQSELWLCFQSPSTLSIYRTHSYSSRLKVSSQRWDERQLYGNPNQSGAALILGFTVTIGLVPLRWRATYVAYVGIGVLLTLSRGAMLGFVLVVLGLWIKRLLTIRQIATATLICGIGVWVAAATLLPMLVQQFNLDPTFIFDRLLWIMDPEARADFSQLERAYLVDRGWQQFLQSPILGNGIGSTRLWDARSSTHNVYVMLLKRFRDYMERLWSPTLLFAIARYSGANATPERWILVGFVLLWGVISHNVLSEYADLRSDDGRDARGSCWR